jgi:hypothetical protein
VAYYTINVDEKYKEIVKQLRGKISVKAFIETVIDKERNVSDPHWADREAFNDSCEDAKDQISMAHGG